MRKFIEEKCFLIMWIVGLSMVTGFVWGGYGSEEYIIRDCVSTVSKYVTAEYSETTSGIDMEGDFYIDTDHWSEPASERYTITKVNELPEHPSMPEHDKSMSRERHFDRFTFHVDKNLEVSVFNEESTSIFSEHINKAPRCLLRIGDPVVIDTWYSITYGSDF